MSEATPSVTLSYQVFYEGVSAPTEKKQETLLFLVNFFFPQKLYFFIQRQNLFLGNEI